MQSSLKKLAQLDPNTLVYCGHEYTKENMVFAVIVEPDNPDVRAKEARISEKWTFRPNCTDETQTVFGSSCANFLRLDCICAAVPSKNKPHPALNSVSPVKTACSCPSSHKL
ncbi:unnamed protein product [Rotaria sp. Silwood1]|nr:unnamed protein product [Rotaria sp. Silwood1]